MEELDKIKAKQAKLEKIQAQLAQRIAALEKEVQKPKEKGYTWEECFKKEGYFVGIGTDIEFESQLSVYVGHKNIATTEKVCKSHLAACQLSHIIERLNKDFGGDENYCVVIDKLNNDTQHKFYYSDSQKWALPMLKSYLAFNKLIETNTPLLKQYFGIDE